MDWMAVAREFLENLKAQEVLSAHIYGSVARGEPSEKSDIDILLVSKDKSTTKNHVYSRVLDFLVKKRVYISVKVLEEEELRKLNDTYFIKRSWRKEAR